MGNFQSRLDRIEEIIAPKEELIVLVVMDHETKDQALAAYADGRGLKVSELRGPVVYLTETDARL